MHDDGGSRGGTLVGRERRVFNLAAEKTPCALKSRVLIVLAVELPNPWPDAG